MTSTPHPARALAAAAHAAGLAPSVHNTQPWRWRVFRDHLDLFADRTRQLGVMDPQGRLLLISCGAALHHAATALAAHGWRAEVDRLPDPTNPDHLARLRAPAHVGVTTEAVRRFQSAERRRSDRRPVTDTAPAAPALAAIRSAVEGEQLYLHLLPADQVEELAVAVARAVELESADPALQAELSLWVGGPRPEGVGLPDTVIPAAASHADVRQRDFGRPGTLPTGPGTDRAAAYGVLFGNEDTSWWWLRSGEALSAAWLTATAHGVGLLPFSAPMEVPATRTILRRLLSGLGHPYLVVRLGLADPDQPGPAAVGRLAPAQVVELVDLPPAEQRS